MSDRNKSLIIYIVKNIAGLLLCFCVTRFLPGEIDYSWSLISVVLVLSPEGKDAWALAKTRMKANIVGGLTGILLFMTKMPHPLNLCVGVIVSLIISDRMKLSVGSRSTLAALIIILLHEPGVHLWDAALSRVSAVGFGCFVGFMITYIFHSLFKINAPVITSENNNQKSAEA